MKDYRIVKIKKFNTLELNSKKIKRNAWAKACASAEASAQALSAGTKAQKNLLIVNYFSSAL